MHLPIRPSEYRLPAYSLTGDLLSFLRCGLQYRYNVIGKLPSSNPVQLWFGQFIHGVLEESYRRYNESRSSGSPGLPPWKNALIDEIINLIKDRLAIQGLYPWDQTVEEMGIDRAKLAINELGVDLFPLIHQAEVRLTGARELPFVNPNLRVKETERYEITGVVDVITHIQLQDPKYTNNRIVRSIIDKLPLNYPSEFEVIIDYKGMRRPPSVLSSTSNTTLWDQYNWQIQTYAHLRRTQTDKPIIAGILLYINELMPSKTDMELLKKEVRSGVTDVLPALGTNDIQLLKKWKPNHAPPAFSYNFRLERAMRVIPINDSSITNALSSFDNVVKKIEECIGKEFLSGQLINSWDKDGSDQSTCTACDAKTFCPVSHERGLPKLPIW